MVTTFTNLFTKWEFSDAYFASFNSYIPLSVLNIVTIVLAVVLFNTIDYLPRMTRISGIKGSIARKSTYAVLAIVVVAAFIYLQSMDIESSFIYFQF